MSENKKKILVVEDDEFISSMYQTKLEREGFIAVVVSNGGEVVDAAKKENPDAIVLDVMLPGEDGFTILAELKADKDTKKIPVVMLTNLGTEEDIRKGKGGGAIDYVVKANATPAEVVQVIEKYI